MDPACRCIDTNPVPLYEQEALHELTGGALRPGGLALTRELLAGCGFLPGAVVLDVGCGPGHSLALMAREFGLRPAGLDPSPVMLAKARRKAPEAELHQGSAMAIPCDPICFDGVLCECVLSLTDDPALGLAEMHRVLKPGGRLLLTDLYCRQPVHKVRVPGLKSCLNGALPLDIIIGALIRASFTLVQVRDRSDLLRQLAGQIIFTYGSLEHFWGLFMDRASARRTSCALATAPLGYYALIAESGYE